MMTHSKCNILISFVLGLLISNCYAMRPASKQATSAAKAAFVPYLAKATKGGQAVRSVIAHPMMTSCPSVIPAHYRSAIAPVFAPSSFLAPHPARMFQFVQPAHIQALAQPSSSSVPQALKKLYGAPSSYFQAQLAQQSCPQPMGGGQIASMLPTFVKSAPALKLEVHEDVWTEADEQLMEKELLQSQQDLVSAPQQQIIPAQKGLEPQELQKSMERKLAQLEQETIQETAKIEAQEQALQQELAQARAYDFEQPAIVVEHGPYFAQGATKGRQQAQQAQQLKKIADTSAVKIERAPYFAQGATKGRQQAQQSVMIGQPVESVTAQGKVIEDISGAAMQRGATQEPRIAVEHAPYFAQGATKGRQQAQQAQQLKKIADTSAAKIERAPYFAQGATKGRQQAQQSVMVGQPVESVTAQGKVIEDVSSAAMQQGETQEPFIAIEHAQAQIPQAQQIKKIEDTSAATIERAPYFAQGATKGRQQLIQPNVAHVIEPIAQEQSEQSNKLPAPDNWVPIVILASAGDSQASEPEQQAAVEPEPAVQAEPAREPESAPVRVAPAQCAAAKIIAGKVSRNRLHKKKKPAIKLTVVHKAIQKYGQEMMLALNQSARLPMWPDNTPTIHGMIQAYNSQLTARADGMANAFDHIRTTFTDLITTIEASLHRLGY